MDDLNTAETTPNEEVDQLTPTQTQELSDSPTTSQVELREQTLNIAAPKKALSKKRKAAEDPRVTFDVLKKVSTKEKDECATFGEHISSKLRKFDDITRATAMHHINTILYQMECEYYTNRKKNSAHTAQQQRQIHFTPSPAPSTSDYHPSSSPATLESNSPYSDPVCPLATYVQTFTDIN